jgi:hypothetical protein
MRMAFVLEDWDCVPMEVKRLAVFYCTHQLDTLGDCFLIISLLRRMCRFGCERRIHDRRGHIRFFNIHANQKLFIDARGFRSLDSPYHHSHEDDHGEESTPDDDDDDDDDDGHTYNRVACSEYTRSKAQHGLLLHISLFHEPGKRAIYQLASYSTPRLVASGVNTRIYFHHFRCSFGAAVGLSIGRYLTSRDAMDIS